MKSFKVLILSLSFTQSCAVIPINSWIDSPNYDWVGNTTEIHTLITWRDEIGNYQKSTQERSDNVTLETDEYPWCTDKSTRFETSYQNGKSVNKGCQWVQRKTDKRCTLKDVRQNCPLTCGYCQCLDNEDRFLIQSGFFSGKKKTCNWVYGNTIHRCKLTEVSSNCPLACGKCDDVSGSDNLITPPTALPTETIQDSVKTINAPS